MGLYRILIVFLAVYTQTVIGNVEKTIFIAPSALTIPLDHPTFNNLQLKSLSPRNSVVRTQLQAEFPSNDSPRGAASWFILNGLSEGQRYEVRVCWAATQPTSFHLETYEVSDVFKDLNLILSLAEFSETQQQREDEYAEVPTTPTVEPPVDKEANQSALLLRISTAADYYTSDTGLMHSPPLVLVDIILDPFIFNIFPRSLLPTAGYIGIVAVGSFFVASFARKFLSNVAKTDTQKKNK